MAIEFEDILKTVGDFGRYQKILMVVVLLPTSAAIAMFYLGVVFSASTPDHWCNVPEIAQSNLTLSQQQILIRPKSDPFCTTYDVDFGTLQGLEDLMPNASWPTKKCTNGWQYDKTDYDVTAVTRWNMVCDDQHYTSLVMSMVFAGDVIGTPVFGHLSDRFGRKPVFFVLAAFAALTEIGSTLLPNFITFFLLRAVNGSVITVLYINSYVMVLELVGTNMRTHVNGIATSAWTGGLCLLPFVAWFTRNWVYLSAFCSCSAFLFLFYWKLFPESPRWLIAEGRYDEAFDVLSDISKTNGNKVHESEELRQQIEKLGEKFKKEKESGTKESPFVIFKHPQLRKRFALITMCWIGASISYYGLVMNVRNLSGNQFLNFFMMAILEFPSHAVTWYCMERIGRRWTAIGAFLITGVSCLIPAFDFSGLATVTTVSAFIGKIGTSSAYMTLYQMSPELYPTNLRSFGMSASATIAVSASLTVPYFVDLAYYGNYVPFLIFSCAGVVSALCAAFLPETLNKTLPQNMHDVEQLRDVEKPFSCLRPKTNSELTTCENSICVEKIRALSEKMEVVLNATDLQSMRSISDAPKPPTNNETK